MRHIRPVPPPRDPRYRPYRFAMWVAYFLAIALSIGAVLAASPAIPYEAEVDAAKKGLLQARQVARSRDLTCRRCRAWTRRTSRRHA